MMSCSFCGGELEERLVQHTYRWEGKLFVFEEVPARVCCQCQVVKVMEQTVLSQLEPKRILRVPVFYSEMAVA